MGKVHCSPPASQLPFEVWPPPGHRGMGCTGELGVGGSQVPRPEVPLFQGLFFLLCTEPRPPAWLSSELSKNCAHHCRYEVKVKSLAGRRRSCQDRLAGALPAEKSKPACWQRARAQCYQLRRATLRPPDLRLPASPSQGLRLLDVWGWSWLWGLPWVWAGPTSGANSNHQG